MNQYQANVARWLSALGIQWTAEFPICGYSVDLYIPEMKRGIEIDGPHHSLSRKRDAEKDRRLLSAGITIVRVRTGTPKDEAMERILAWPE